MSFWKTSGLGALALGYAVLAQAQPPAATHLGLDFLYVVVDKPTAAAVENSDYLRHFGHLIIKEQRNSEGHYRGMFLTGRENVMEIYSTDSMDLDHRSADGEGRAGVELTSDHAGDLAKVKAAAEAKHVAMEQHTTRTAIDGHEVDWFTYIERAGASTSDEVVPPGFGVAMEEYFPAYMDLAHKPPALGPDDVMSRARYHRVDYDPSLPLRGIKAATFAITAENWKADRDLLAADGFRIEEKDGGARAVSDDLELDMVFVPKNKIGVRKIVFALNNAPAQPHVEQLGHSQLAVGPGANAVWTFASR